MVSGYLRLRQGLVPGQPLLVVVGGCGGVVWREGPSLLGPFSLPGMGGLPFILPLRLGERVFLFLLLVVGGGGSLVVFGRPVLSALAARATFGPLGLLLGLLLQHHVRCRNQ